MSSNHRLRFDAKWERSDGGCWLWTSSTFRDGYGSFYLDGRPHSAHRVSYELHVGPIPDGLQIDHLCMVRGCVNPEHLEPVTRLENVRRGRRSRGHPDHLCCRGHEFTDSNTYRYPGSGARVCRTCRRIDQAKYLSRSQPSLGGQTNGK